MKVRLPTAARYVAQVEKEHRWLPYLAASLPLRIPVPLVVGAPTNDYPFPWAVYQWINGDTASTESHLDLSRFATDLAQFLVALEHIPINGGPRAGPHSFFRGGPLSVYDSETRQCLEELRSEIDTVGSTALWEKALASHTNGPDVWVHGDISVGNLLVVDGKLSAVIDFGSCAIGDPACDLVIAWTFLTGQSREAFRSTVTADEATWARARGWALWKALLKVSNEVTRNIGNSLVAQDARRTIADILAEHGGAAG
jgi:aminoglycoside phosphotransferase (APT) family kinase protein